MTARTKQKEAIDAGALEEHVRQLASVIGERNVFCSAALSAAAVYIEKTWANQGDEVPKHVYEIHDQQSANQLRDIA